ncbi:methyltransferase [Pleomorphomonas diazotrophica]|uniref:Methyltransferase n=1 Tax=Pleomorphomonas diazotrophica TaxID=1166257 RepID=A0A1I4QJK7_9HYPH|nr:methyltransferase [Pleomorphomonas diazotrophica]PKR90615.1 methyltransferase [Pleomorphomonas diazotrophica]SFM40249.1 tRNA1(Val) A37 N6-methylase TrmN6 [Pleomorphomonas diazotrophica]
MTLSGVTSRDGFLDNKLMIDQPLSGAHRAGLDAVLLAAALPERTTGHVVDLGAGVGVAGLAAAHRLPEISVTLVEIDPELAGLAEGNAALNAGTAGRVSIVIADVLAPAAERRAAGLLDNMADHLVMNPPFHPADRGRSSPAASRARAHALAADAMEGWVRAAAAVLKPSGTLTVIFRADELPRLLSAIGNRFGSLTLLPIHAHAGEPAHRLILRGRPQGRAPLRILPGLTLHAPDGGFLPEAEAALRGGGLPVVWW